MPFLILGIALLIGLAGLYRLFLRADAAQIRATFLALGAMALSGGIIVLSLTGRLGGALGMVILFYPLIQHWLRHRKTKTAPVGDGEMTRLEALEILGLDGRPDRESIDRAYKRLMMKLHPDRDGTKGLAKRLNLARDCLLKNSR